MKTNLVDRTVEQFAVSMAHPLVTPIITTIPADLYPISEAAALFKISDFAIRRWANRGQIRLFGGHGAFRVSLSEVAAPARPGTFIRCQPRRKTIMPQDRRGRS